MCRIKQNYFPPLVGDQGEILIVSNRQHNLGRKPGAICVQRRTSKPCYQCSCWTACFNNQKHVDGEKHATTFSRELEQLTTSPADCNQQPVYFDAFMLKTFLYLQMHLWGAELNVQVNRVGCLSSRKPCLELCSDFTANFCGLVRNKTNCDTGCCQINDSPKGCTIFIVSGCLRICQRVHRL